MSNLLKKESTQKPFKFDDEAQKSFENIKNSFASSPMLRQWDPHLKGILETDASGGGISGILSQKYNGVKRPVAFWSRKIQPEETRYGTPDQELLAVVDALIHFRVYLEGAQHKILIYSDHANLRYFISTIRPNRRQSGYIGKLAGYDFEIYHCEGKKNPADAPSRRPDYMEKNEDDDKDWGLNLKDDCAKSANINAVVSLEFKNSMAEALHADEFASQILQNGLPDEWHLEDDAL
ncbi:hypothetical protein K3495_g13191 [Podosphaera aphanis]|nr:hypothetical protein K3495_g13191 [Podosphaera aphanis]